MFSKSLTETIAPVHGARELAKLLGIRIPEKPLVAEDLDLGLLLGNVEEQQLATTRSHRLYSAF